MPIRRSLPVASAAIALALAATPALAVSGVLAADEPTQATDGPVQATILLDLSGLASLGPDQALAVHDGKNPDENDRPRASILTLTDSPTGVTWQPVAFEWPAEMGPASDLESASGIPGSSLVLLAESGDEASDFQRLFLAEIDANAEGGPSATITGSWRWERRQQCPRPRRGPARRPSVLSLPGGPAVFASLGLSRRPGR